MVRIGQMNFDNTELNEWTMDIWNSGKRDQPLCVFSLLLICESRLKALSMPETSS